MLVNQHPHAESGNSPPRAQGQPLQASASGFQALMCPYRYQHPHRSLIVDPGAPCDLTGADNRRPVALGTAPGTALASPVAVGVSRPLASGSALDGALGVSFRRHPSYGEQAQNWRESRIGRSPEPERIGRWSKCSRGHAVFIPAGEPGWCGVCQRQV